MLFTHVSGGNHFPATKPQLRNSFPGPCLLFLSYHFLVFKMGDNIASNFKMIPIKWTVLCPCILTRSQHVYSYNRGKVFPPHEGMVFLLLWPVWFGFEALTGILASSSTWHKSVSPVEACDPWTCKALIYSKAFHHSKKIFPYLLSHIKFIWIKKNKYTNYRNSLH